MSQICHFWLWICAPRLGCSHVGLLNYQRWVEKDWFMKKYTLLPNTRKLLMTLHTHFCHTHTLKLLSISHTHWNCSYHIHTSATHWNCSWHHTVPHTLKLLMTLHTHTHTHTLLPHTQTAHDITYPEWHTHWNCSWHYTQWNTLLPHTKTAHDITYTLLPCTETAHDITYTLLPHTWKLLMTSHTQNATHKLVTLTAVYSHFQISIVNKLAHKLTEKLLWGFFIYFLFHSFLLIKLDASLPGIPFNASPSNSAMLDFPHRAVSCLYVRLDPLSVSVTEHCAAATHISARCQQQVNSTNKPKR